MPGSSASLAIEVGATASPTSATTTSAGLRRSGSRRRSARTVPGGSAGWSGCCSIPTNKGLHHPPWVRQRRAIVLSGKRLVPTSWLADRREAVRRGYAELADSFAVGSRRCDHRLVRGGGCVEFRPGSDYCCDHARGYLPRRCDLLADPERPDALPALAAQSQLPS